MAVEKHISTPEKLGLRVVRLAHKAVDYGVLIICLLLLVLGAYSLWDSNRIVEEAQTSRFIGYKPTSDDSLSFEELRSRNSDVFAWLTLYGTSVDLPVAHTDNNVTYMNTDALGEYSLTGSLFLDQSNATDFSDFNSIIYGHHMEAGAMFGDLDKFADQSFFDSHRYGNLYFEGIDHGFEIFAFLEVDAYDWDIYHPGITDKQAQEEYLAKLKDTSSHWREVGLSTDDSIVLLSTCSSYTTNGRYILVGRITSERYPDTFANQEGSAEEFFWGSLLGNGGKATFPWIWLVLFIILIVLVVLLTRAIKSRGRRSNEHKGKAP